MLTRKKHRWHAAVAAVIMKHADNLAAHLLLNGTGQMAPDNLAAHLLLHLTYEAAKAHAAVAAVIMSA